MSYASIGTSVGVLVVSTLASILTANIVTANAADLPGGDRSFKDAEPVFSPVPLWQGFYLGLHAGYVHTDIDGTLAISPSGNLGIPNPDQTLEDDGFLAGGQIGYNFQRGTWVFGLEGDIAYAGIDASETYSTITFGNCCSFDKHHEFEIEYLGTLRGRLGYASGNLLAYVTGGFAWAEVHGSLTVTRNDVGGPSFAELSGASSDKTHTGWTLGGGVEAALNDRWSLKAEYLYVDLGEEDYAFSGTKVDEFGAPTGNDTIDEFNSADIDLHTVKIGLNYRFTSRREPMELLK